MAGTLDASSLGSPGASDTAGPGLGVELSGPALSSTDAAAGTGRAIGRPPLYTDELAGFICELIAQGGALIDILRDQRMPSYTTVCKWRRDIPEFAQMYARAREDQADHEAEEIKQIADERPPMVEDTNHKAGGSRMDSAAVAWQKNRIDVRKWRASKMRPGVYADKVDHTVAGPDGGPMEFRWKS